MIRDGGKQRLIVGLASPQSIDRDLMINEIDFTAHQAMDPVGCNKPVLAQEAQVSCCVSPAEKDQSPARHSTGIELPMTAFFDHAGQPYKKTSA